MAPQLRQVPAAWQSAQVPVKHEQKPVAGKILQAIRLVVHIPQRKGNSFLPYHAHNIAPASNNIASTPESAAPGIPGLLQ